MKKLPSKADIRRQLEQEVSAFLQQGGDIVQVQTGTSGHPHNSYSREGMRALFDEPKVERKYLPEVVAAIESRRSPAPKPSKRPKTKPNQVQKLIYDDFGEPLRWVWVEE